MATRLHPDSNQPFPAATNLSQQHSTSTTGEARTGLECLQGPVNHFVVVAPLDSTLELTLRLGMTEGSHSECEGFLLILRAGFCEHCHGNQARLLDQSCLVPDCTQQLPSLNSQCIA